MEKLQPKLRFPEFEGYWEITKIGDYIELLSGIALKGEEISDDPTGTPILRGINITEGYIRHSTEIDKYYIGNLNRIDNFFVKENDLVLGMDGSKVGKNVALITKKDENSILIQRVARIRATPKSNIKYIYHNIFSTRFHDYVDVVNTSSGIPHISSQQIKEFTIGFPNLPEQTKIASFLTVVDEKISGLKKQLTLLERYKKGVMQKIFSQELRFKDENDNGFPDWEEKKLGEVCNIKRGASPRPITDKKWFDNNSKIGWVRISDISKSNKYLEKTEQYFSPSAIEKSRFVKKGNMIMSICATLGKPIYTNIDVCIPDSFVVFEKLSLEKEYFFYYLDFIQLNWYKYGQPGTQVNLNSEIVSNETIPVPCNFEQQKIAFFLSSIDDKIEKCQSQIRSMEKWKKGLLQQMFI